MYCFTSNIGDQLLSYIWDAKKPKDAWTNLKCLKHYGPGRNRPTIGSVYFINMSSSKAIRLEVPQALWSGKERVGNSTKIGKELVLEMRISTKRGKCVEILGEGEREKERKKERYNDVF